MAASNIFSGVTVKYVTVQQYRNTTNFDHFVFQQAIDEDSPVNGDNFTLVVYAVTKALTVLNGGKPILYNETNLCNFPGTKPYIQFANMRLNETALEGLYPNGVTSDLTVCPVGYYNNGNYILYEASTITSTLVLIKTLLNPSPPHSA